MPFFPQRSRGPKRRPSAWIILVMLLGAMVIALATGRVGKQQVQQAIQQNAWKPESFELEIAGVHVGGDGYKLEVSMPSPESPPAPGPVSGKMTLDAKRGSVAKIGEVEVGLAMISAVDVADFAHESTTWTGGKVRFSVWTEVRLDPQAPPSNLTTLFFVAAPERFFDALSCRAFDRQGMVVAPLRSKVYWNSRIGAVTFRNVHPADLATVELFPAIR